MTPEHAFVAPPTAPTADRTEMPPTADPRDPLAASIPLVPTLNFQPTSTQPLFSPASQRGVGVQAGGRVDLAPTPLPGVSLLSTDHSLHAPDEQFFEVDDRGYDFDNHVTAPSCPVVRTFTSDGGVLLPHMQTTVQKSLQIRAPQLR